MASVQIRRESVPRGGIWKDPLGAENHYVGRGEATREGKWSRHSGDAEKAMAKGAMLQQVLRRAAVPCGAPQDATDMDLGFSDRLERQKALF